MVQPHRIERQEGDGAGDEIDDMYDGEEYQSKDRRANTRTTYYERDIDTHCTDPEYAKRLKRALRWQEGEHVNAEDMESRGQQNHREDKRRLVGALGGRLELTSAQKKRVEHLVQDVISVNSFGNYSSEQVILAVINVVVREDGRWIEDEDEFRDAMHDVGIVNDADRVDMDTMQRLRELTRDRIPSKERRGI